jgi:hypothetical protein
MVVWYFTDTKDKWADPQNKLACTWKDTKIKSNANMILSFMINISGTDGQWRSIIHITNQNRDCCNIGDRVPAIWITPNTTTLVICNDNSNGGNHHFYTPAIKMNTNVQVTIYWYGRYVRVFFDNVLVNNYTHVNTFTSPTSGAYVYIGDSWYGTLNSSRRFKLRDLYLKDILANDDYELLKVGNDVDTACRGANWDTRPKGGTYPIGKGLVTPEQCARFCNEDKNCVAIDFNSNMNVASGTNDCWLFNNKGSTVGERTNGGALGCYKKIKVEVTDCNYIMSNSELDCYNDRYPDLQDAFKGDKNKLQSHWRDWGCKSSELRNNQCPSIQNIAGNYKYKGCYNEKTTDKAVPNYRGKVNSPNECASLAEQNKESIFALNNIGGDNNCYTGSSESSALKYGWNNKSSIDCSPTGGIYTNQVYIRDVLYADKPKNAPDLQSFNFANEKFSNSEEENIAKTKYNMMKISVIIIILILLIIIGYCFIKK